MILKFSTRRGQITMLGEPALRLLTLGGHSGTVPGAILAADLPAFLAQLRARLTVHGAEVSPAAPTGNDEADDDDDTRPREPLVALQTRALPLIGMVETAIANGSDLMWDRA